MTTFDYTFTVDAPLEVVTTFHHDTRVLKLLTPPPIFAQVHDYEPLADGSKAEFTLWFGPLPVRWTAVHSDVVRNSATANGFTDTQLRGPLKAWRHSHRFSADGPDRTRVTEHIEYAHDGGARGLFSRLLFSRPGLYGLFTARKFLTRYHVRRAIAANALGSA